MWIRNAGVGRVDLDRPRDTEVETRKQGRGTVIISPVLEGRTIDTNYLYQLFYLIFYSFLFLFIRLMSLGKLIHCPLLLSPLSSCSATAQRTFFLYSFSKCTAALKKKVIKFELCE